jgi:flagellar biosynthesis/type III secretory pathway ATPase
VLDKAIAALPHITAFLQQRRDQKPTLDQTLQQLMALPA